MHPLILTNVTKYKWSQWCTPLACCAVCQENKPSPAPSPGPLANTDKWLCTALPLGESFGSCSRLPEVALKPWSPSTHSHRRPARGVSRAPSTTPDEYCGRACWWRRPGPCHCAHPVHWARTLRRQEARASLWFPVLWQGPAALFILAILTDVRWYLIVGFV